MAVDHHGQESPLDVGVEDFLEGFVDGKAEICVHCPMGNRAYLSSNIRTCSRCAYIAYMILS